MLLRVPWPSWPKLSHCNKISFRFRRCSQKGEREKKNLSKFSPKDTKGFENNQPIWVRCLYDLLLQSLKFSFKIFSPTSEI